MMPRYQAIPAPQTWKRIAVTAMAQEPATATGSGSRLRSLGGTGCAAGEVAVTVAKGTAGTAARGVGAAVVGSTGRATGPAGKTGNSICFGRIAAARGDETGIVSELEQLGH